MRQLQVYQLFLRPQLKHKRNIREMCLNELDLSQFLSEDSPVAQDISFEVSNDFTSTETFKAHRYKLFIVREM